MAPLPDVPAAELAVVLGGGAWFSGPAHQSQRSGFQGAEPKQRNSLVKRGWVIKTKGSVVALRPRPLHEPNGCRLHEAGTRTPWTPEGAESAGLQKEDPAASALPAGDPRII